MGPADLSNKMLMYHSITIKKSLGRKTAALAAYVAQFRVLDKSQIFLIKKKKCNLLFVSSESQENQRKTNFVQDNQQFPKTSP